MVGTDLPSVSKTASRVSTTMVVCSQKGESADGLKFCGQRPNLGRIVPEESWQSCLSIIQQHNSAATHTAQGRNAWGIHCTETEVIEGHDHMVGAAMPIVVWRFAHLQKSTLVTGCLHV